MNGFTCHQSMATRTRRVSVLVGIGLAIAGCGHDGDDGPSQITGAATIIDEQPLSDTTRQQLLAQPGVGARITIAPAGQSSLVFVIDAIEPAGKGRAYLGHVDQQAASSGTIVVVNTSFAGTLRVLGQPIYQIGHRPQTTVPVIRRIDPNQLPPDHPSGFGVGQRAGDGQLPGPIGNIGDTCSSDDPRRITLMMLYTTAARVAAGGTTDAIEAQIYAAIAEANRSFINSDVDLRLELVRLEETPYAPVGGDLMTDLCRLHDPGDGFLDDVQTKRDTYGADVVGLVIASAIVCGSTYGELIDPSGSCTVASNHDVVQSPSNAHEEGAYHVFRLDCLPTNFTFPHELAHSLSARHNWECDPSDNRPTHSNHGFFRNDGTAMGTWRTIMTYPSTRSCGHIGPRVPNFSNPLINFAGHPTGITGSQPADNHDVLERDRPVIANYRCSTPAPANVWMKDTWGDTGAEPDPDPDIMYASPYVWTRNSADTVVSGTTDRYQHEHEHQNPVLHAPTWAYVKLHNSGPTGAAGRVRLYYANASTSLAWPGAWTPIGSIDVAAIDFAAGSTKVVQIPWADPPGIGHYCLTARWESATDPMPAETADIGANTRQSNNIIWRNLEILRPGSTGDATSQFIARPFEKSEMTLVFASRGAVPFQPNGTIDVTLTSTQTQFTAQAGSGVVQTGSNTFRVVANGGQIKLFLPKPQGDVLASLTLHRTAQQERRHYRVTVDQLEARGTVNVSVGGVALDLEP